MVEYLSSISWKALMRAIMRALTALTKNVAVPYDQLQFPQFIIFFDSHQN